MLLRDKGTDEIVAKQIGEKILNALDKYRNFEEKFVYGLAPDTGAQYDVSALIQASEAVQFGLEILQGGLAVLSSGLETVQVGLEFIKESDEIEGSGD